MGWGEDIFSLLSPFVNIYWLVGHNCYYIGSCPSKRQVPSVIYFPLFHISTWNCSGFGCQLDSTRPVIIVIIKTRCSGLPSPTPPPPSMHTPHLHTGIWICTEAKTCIHRPLNRLKQSSEKPNPIRCNRPSFSNLPPPRLLSSPCLSFPPFSLGSCLSLMTAPNRRHVQISVTYCEIVEPLGGWAVWPWAPSPPPFSAICRSAMQTSQWTVN